jgi:hypothetical protein
MCNMTERTAACSCGQLTVTTTAEPVRVSICHCLACQRRTGSVFGAQARFPTEAVAVDGESSTWSRAGESGESSTFHFCPKCSALAWWQPESMPEVVYVPIGAFADPTFPAPQVSVYGESAHAWVGLPEDLRNE